MTVIQRFGGGLNLNNLHTLLFDGVFFDGKAGEGTLAFWPLPPPTDDEVGLVLARVQRLLERRGLDPGEAEVFQADPVVEESPALAGISSASIQGRAALGPLAGARVWHVGDDPDATWVLATAPRHAHLAGFDLHANSAVPAADRTRLEQLCRYLLRPAVAQDRLRLLSDGRVVLTLKNAWADGTRHLIFEPLTLLEKLAALTPRPRINLVLYHSVLAPHSGWRARVVADGALAGEVPVAASASAAANDEPPPAGSRHYAWAGADEARVRSRRASLPALRRALAPARHGRRPGRDSGDPGCRRGFGRPSAAVRGRADAQPRGGDQRLSGSGRGRRRGLFAGLWGAAHPPGLALRSGRKSRDTLVVRAVRGAETAEGARGSRC